MTDLFDEALARMDAQLGVDPEPVPQDGAPVEGGTPEPQEQPRDEQGRFAPRDPEPEQQPETAQPEPEPEAEAVEPPKPLPLDEEAEKFSAYLSRFGIAYDDVGGLPDSAQKALRAGFEADRHIGRQAQEYGDKLTAMERQLAELAQQQREPEQPPVQTNRYDPNAVADYFAERPTEIIPTLQQAYNSNDRALVYLSLKALDDVDPVMAEGLRVEIAKRDALAELAPQIQPLTERSQQAAFNENVAAGFGRVREKFPDVANHADRMLEAAQSDPEMLRGLTEGTPETAERVLTNLYKIAAYEASQENQQTLTAAHEQAAAQQALEAKAAKHDAFVATGTQRVPDPEPVSDDEAWLREFFDPAAARFYGE